MSILFGVRAADGQSIDEPRLRTLARATERYAPDGAFVAAVRNVGMGIQPYQTHERSTFEIQPAVSERGAMLCFDGRLDNHKDLRELLGLSDENVADSEIVLAAFERWEEGCFGQLVGDWALALWVDARRTLYLARDHAGTRTLYYELGKGTIRWATYLDTFFAETSNRAFDATYISHYLACLPIDDLSPYEGIRAVPPAHYLRIQGDHVTRHEHWSWLRKGEIHYSTDAEYEEHFFALFEQAVGRRTGRGAPILAQLSGGMDSSSIVCMSDHIRRREGAESDALLDTLSYYDDSEPNWNEKPFFEVVERQRGKRGIHLSHALVDEELAPSPVLYLWPGADRSTFDNECRLFEQIGQRGYRVILSGIGGDELLGGVPTPSPELANSLAGLDLVGFFRSALAWCLVDRTPLVNMTGDALRFMIDQYLPPSVSQKSPPRWANSKLKRSVRRNLDHPTSALASWSRPSNIAIARMRAVLLETMPHQRPAHLARLEWRYPFLDRDLDEFLFRVPRRQLVRPGRRRALMRNALKAILPTEIVERRRKASRIRSVLLTLRGQEHQVEVLFNDLPCVMTALVDQQILQQEALTTVRQSDLKQMQAILRALFVRQWAKQLKEKDSEKPTHCSSECQAGSAA
jgi:asparagine synthase (glutamine-hydrolysing)